MPTALNEDVTPERDLTAESAPRCPRHPDRPAYRTCRRCGTFTCALCATPTGEGSFCADCLPHAPQPPEPLDRTTQLFLAIAAVRLYAAGQAVLSAWSILVRHGARPSTWGVTVLDTLFQVAWGVSLALLLSRKRPAPVVAAALLGLDVVKLGVMASKLTAPPALWVTLVMGLIDLGFILHFVQLYRGRRIFIR